MLDILKYKVIAGLAMHLELLLSIGAERRCGFALGWEWMYWILSRTTPRFDVLSPTSTNQCCRSLVAIGSCSFLLLQAVCCIIVQSEKNNITLDQVLLGIWLVKMNCMVITLISPSVVNCATLPIPQVKDKYVETGKSNLAMDVLHHVLDQLYDLLDDTPQDEHVLHLQIYQLRCVSLVYEDH
jgi:hypothetical protein